MKGTRYCAAVVIDESEPRNKVGWRTKIDTRKCEHCPYQKVCGIFHHFRIFHPKLLIRRFHELD